MSRPDEDHADLDAVLAEVKYVPRYVRAAAVRAELDESKKPQRDITQAQLAKIFGVTTRSLRYWVERYNAEGAEGLRARGGQGRKRDVSKKDVSAAIKDAIESTMAEAEEEEEGEGPPCRVCMAEKSGAEGGAASGGKGQRARRAPPKACKCKGECKKPATCKCGPKKVCKCKCCRPLKLPPKGPRHDPGCAGRRVEPRGATRAATVHDLIAKRHGKKYHMHHVHKLLRDNGVTYHKVAKVQSNHASVEEVQAWIRRQEARLKPYREKGYKVCVFDVAFVGMDGATGCMWIRRGAKAVLPNKGSHQTAALHGIYFEDGARCVREYAFADSATLIDFIKAASAKYGKLIVYGDRSSIHSSAETKEFLRRHRRLHPDRDVRLFLLPRGSPYLSVIEAFWNRLKDAVSKRYRYKSFDALRWAAMEYARTVRLKLDLYKFLYSDPRKHVLAS